MPKKFILAGGSGFLGQSLAQSLVQRGDEAIILTRKVPDQKGRIAYARWDGKTLDDWATLLEGAVAIVNLTGKSVNCRYTEANKREIIASRIESVRVLNDAIAQCANPPPVWIQASSLAIYGDRHDEICDENTTPGSGFPVETCLLWEQAFNELMLPHTRKVVLRIGFVLGRGGGALQPLESLTRLFLGGHAGNGKQYISWLHIDDMNHVFEWALDHNDATGIYNATGPHPVTNAYFMSVLRHVMQRPYSPPVPSWAVRIGSRLLNTEADLVLTGRRCVPKKLLAQGFVFNYDDLETTLSALEKA